MVDLRKVLVPPLILCLMVSVFSSVIANPDVMSFSGAIDAVSLGNHKHIGISYAITSDPLEQAPLVDERGITGFLVWLAPNGTFYQVEYPSEKVLRVVAESFSSDWNPPDGYTFWWLNFGEGEEYWVDVSDGSIIHFTLPKWEPRPDSNGTTAITNIIQYVIMPAVIIVVITASAVLIFKRKKQTKT